MSVREEFDEWATAGKDKGMEERHWHTAKHALARMPVEEGDTILDLGTGSGYALRALRETANTGPSYGFDGSPEMVRNARDYTDEDDIEYVCGDFDNLPFEDDSIDHVWSMEAFYYAANPHNTLEEIARVLRPGGTFYCAVNYYEENVHSHEWQEYIEVEMTRWDREQYREAFRDAGLSVAEQDNIPDREITIPSGAEFPTEDWDSREAMVERYREYGTLLTVGVTP
ncbi:class I SAM-dependent methyltransferase [Natronobacterium gregoryi]|uniref:Class I SAM-dependent methyltransferase n=2 Tax=Natronobacterium gregoryi TaxID=44930 RepID=L0AFW9_NATGS|nr:class I SAM-dependent methyltransferase [Natronobacterium gregoryi]AFZ72808.1 methylase involved in ubiquinone/menaquinone biosynthesis [Natronobacterium gregoryi SP2]ELY69428.1 type 11 methyltransferase [Natronobacterium gregoryi SP2]PLK21148.1 class I SAM-dependent methyltransferase [Natronobacterium gregoryi SP2]SFJ10262.1 Methyltransferase domain-containing protein [Natronobacterium gregoryi]